MTNCDEGTAGTVHPECIGERHYSDDHGTGSARKMANAPDVDLQKDEGAAMPSTSVEDALEKKRIEMRPYKSTITMSNKPIEHKKPGEMEREKGIGDQTLGYGMATNLRPDGSVLNATEGHITRDNAEKRHERKMDAKRDVPTDNENDTVAKMAKILGMKPAEVRQYMGNLNILRTTPATKGLYDQLIDARTKVQEEAQRDKAAKQAEADAKKEPPATAQDPDAPVEGPPMETNQGAAPKGFRPGPDRDTGELTPEQRKANAKAFDTSKRKDALTPGGSEAESASRMKDGPSRILDVTPGEGEGTEFKVNPQSAQVKAAENYAAHDRETHAPGITERTPAMIARDAANPVKPLPPKSKDGELAKSAMPSMADLMKASDEGSERGLPSGYKPYGFNFNGRGMPIQNGYRQVFINRDEPAMPDVKDMKITKN